MIATLESPLEIENEITKIWKIRKQDKKNEIQIKIKLYIRI